MKQLIGKKAKQIALVFALLYFSSYVMRINFAVMLVKVLAEMQVEKSALSIVLTALTLMYSPEMTRAFRARLSQFLPKRERFS